MLLEESQRRQGELIGILYDMAYAIKDEAGIEEIANKLSELCSDGFRHQYSELFPLVIDIGSGDGGYNLDYLSNNLAEVRTLVENDYLSKGKRYTSLYRPLTKISDHINLEIARYNYYSISEQYQQDLEARNRELLDQLETSTAALEDAKKNVSTVQTELISVLSIFAAIVLTFSGSMSLLGNALIGMQEAPFFKSIFFITLCGFIVMNAIFLMLYMVGKLTQRNIYVSCENGDCICDRGNLDCKGIARIKKRLPYVFWLNVVLLSILIIDIIMWAICVNCECLQHLC